MEYPVIELKSGKDKPVWQRHPWLFSGAIKRIIGSVGEGDIVYVADNKGKIMAKGFYSAKSQISVRLFDFGQDLQSNVDDMLHRKIAHAYALRKSFIQFSHTNAYRLLHAEGDFLPGIIVDIYNNVAVCQFLIVGTAKLAPQMLTLIKKITGVSYIYIKTKTSSTELESVELTSGWWQNNAPKNSKISILENAIRFEIDVEKGQKTGFFLDQRDNRAIIESISNQKTILNTFAYSGGFSVAALRGGAKKVVSVDISKDAIELCKKTIELQDRSDYIDKHTTMVSDVFEYLKKQTEKFDIVILDPPAFAKNAKSVDNAARGYKELNMLGLKSTNPGGICATFSCSQNISMDLFQKIVFSAASDLQIQVRIIKKLTQPLDHPINIFHPESEYLKGLLLYVG